MRTSLLLVVVGAVGLGGCSQESGSPSGGTSSGTPEMAAPRALTPDQLAKVEKAVAVRKALEGGQDPDAVLKAHGLTEQQFDDLMFAIAEDEAMAAAYAARTGP